MRGPGASGMQVTAEASPFALAFDKDAASSEPCWPGLSFEDACRTATPPSQPPPQSTSIAPSSSIDTLDAVSIGKCFTEVASNPIADSRVQGDDSPQQL